MAAQLLPLSLYRAEQVRELDRIAIEEMGIPGITLMERAGEAAFEWLRSDWPRAQHIVVVCGPGNNGGDGFVLARLAREEGLDVRVLLVGEPESLRGDALLAAQGLQAAGLVPEPFEPARVAEADVIVDALFGTGLQREVTGAWRAAVEAMNAGSPVLAIDIPSGLHADTGRALGVAVRARRTVSFIGLKQGLFTGDGPECRGRLAFADLQVPPATYDRLVPAARRVDPDEFAAWLSPRPRSAHKGRYGHVLIVGGDHGMGGAARMAAEGALRVGAGLVTVATREAHAAALTAVRPELMCRGVEGGPDLEPLLARASVIAIGPGLARGEWGRGLLAACLDTALPLVLDADALNLLAEAPHPRGDWVLTPHPAEAGRLLGHSAGEVQDDRFGALAALGERYRGTCVLKGAGSLIRDEQGAVWVCDAGNPGMASGGMGDVLTGVIAGLAAQGLALGQAARAGVWLHAAAADMAARDGERGMLAMDLMPHLRRLANRVDPFGEGR
jgi:ADP-dependent NAD(P)H-hydrate dehydratase / NAD(P)H-hydrate epimerase